MFRSKSRLPSTPGPSTRWNHSRYLPDPLLLARRVFPAGKIILSTTTTPSSRFWAWYNLSPNIEQTHGQSTATATTHVCAYRGLAPHSNLRSHYVPVVVTGQDNLWSEEGFHMENVFCGTGTEIILCRNVSTHLCLQLESIQGQAGSSSACESSRSCFPPHGHRPVSPM